MDPRVVKTVFLGGEYKCYHPPTKKIYVVMDVTFVENQQYFDSTYLLGENISTLEDRWDWDAEKELKEGTNIIVAEKNDVIVAEMNDTVAETVDKANGNKMVVHPS